MPNAIVSKTSFQPFFFFFNLKTTWTTQALRSVFCFEQKNWNFHIVLTFIALFNLPFLSTSHFLLKIKKPNLNDKGYHSDLVKVKTFSFT